MENRYQPREPLTVFKLVAVGTVAVLLALVVVAKVGKQRALRDMIQCNSNQKQIGLSFHVIASDHFGMAGSTRP